jgi:hypothetical protein
MSQPDWMKDAPAWVREGREMNEAEWLEGPGLIWMVSFVLHRYLDRLGEDRRHLLFGCACCRRVWELLPLDTAKRLLELAELYADGEVSEAVFLAGNDPAMFPGLDLQCRGQAEPGTQLSACVLQAIGGVRWMAAPNFRKSHGAYGVAQETCLDRMADYLPSSERPWGGWGGMVVVPPDQTQLADRMKLMWEIYGNPFRTVAIDTRLSTPTVTALATAAYEERDLPSGHLHPARLAVLSDALEEAGCTDQDILSHLRSPGPHIRGCWALDHILGRA